MIAVNHEALIGQQVAEELPAIVGEVAKAFSSIGSMTVLNDAGGMGDVFRQVLGMGVAAIPMLRGALEQTNGTANGAAASSPAPKREDDARQARDR